jgi:hypothetical protein
MKLIVVFAKYLSLNTRLYLLDESGYHYVTAGLAVPH